MIRSILVPLDGSRFAEAALPLAVRLARAAHGHLNLLLAHETAPLLVPSGAPMWDLPDDPGKRERATTYLARTAACLPANGRPIEYEIVDGEIGPALAERIMSDSPDLVVMATHGRGTIGRLWRGSVADYLVRHVSVPVLLVRPDRHPGHGAGTGFRKILVPLDLSDMSDLILEPVKAVARITQSHLTLVHVVEPMFELTIPDPPTAAPPDTSLMDIEVANAQRHLDVLAARLRAEGFSAATRVIRGLGVSGTLLDALRAGCFDMVALTTHGRGGLKRAALGSVATRLIMETAQPVLVFRPNLAQ